MLYKVNRTVVILCTYCRDSLASARVSKYFFVQIISRATRLCGVSFELFTTKSVFFFVHVSHQHRLFIRVIRCVCTRTWCEYFLCHAHRLHIIIYNNIYTRVCLEIFNAFTTVGSKSEAIKSLRCNLFTYDRLFDLCNYVLCPDVSTYTPFHIITISEPKIKK